MSLLFLKCFYVYSFAARPSGRFNKTTMYSLYYIYFSQHNYKIKAGVKATCFDLKSHRQAKLRTVKFLA